MKNYAVTVNVINTVDPDKAVIIRHVERSFTYAVPAVRLYSWLTATVAGYQACEDRQDSDYTIELTFEAINESDRDGLSFHMDAGRLLEDCISELDDLLEE